MPRPSLSACRTLLVALAVPAPLVMASACQVVSGLSGYQIGNGGAATGGAATGGTATGGASSSSSGASSSGVSSSGTSSSGSASSSSGSVGWCGTLVCAVGDPYDYVSTLAADDAGVYWTAIPSGGPPERIYWAKTGSSNASSAPLIFGDSFQGLATDESGKLYYTAGGTDPSHLYALNLADGGATQISATATAAGDAGAVAVVSASGPDVAWVTRSSSPGLEVTTGSDTQVTIPGPPANLVLAGGASRHVFFAADADLYSLGPGTAATFLGNVSTPPTFIAPDDNLSNGWLYFVDTSVRRILKKVPDGGVDGWVTPSIPTTVTVTGFVATDAPYWMEVNNSSHLGQILTTQTSGAGTRDPLTGPTLSAYPKLLAAGGGYLYFAIQDTTVKRWHVNAVPLP